MEHNVKPLPSKKVFARHIAEAVGVSVVLLVISLGVGMVGYNRLGHLGWMDSFLNASMILTGMGPVNPMVTSAAKFFAGVYALFSGVIFLTMASIMMGPFLHRLLHVFHLNIKD